VRELVDGWPYAAVFALFFASGMARSNLTYWAGRGLRYGGGRSRFGRHLDRPAVLGAETVVRRFGAPLVVLAFLTVGVQTAVNAAAGSLRMPLRRYVPATVVGSLLWATLYTTVGLTVLGTVLGGGSPWWWAVTAVLVALVAVGSHVVARRVGVPTPDETGEPVAEPV
jgi:membrane protein DedA with SNARE-associated domain